MTLPAPGMTQLGHLYGQELIDALPAWMTNYPDIASAFIDEIIEAGGTSNTNAALLALEEIRMAPEYRSMYDFAFPGNRREDGSLRMEEGTYFAEVQTMRSYVEGVGINADIFNNDYGSLFADDVFAAEFGQRVDAMYSSLISSNVLPETRQFYADNFALDLSDEAILASIMKPDLGTEVLAGNILSSQIGGAASRRGFDIELTFAEMIAGAGASEEDAGRFFGEAASLLPSLNILAARHADPNDPLDLQDLADLSFFQDPEQRRTVNRLLAQEESTFTGGAQVDFMRSRTGGVTGLRDV